MRNLSVTLAAIGRLALLLVLWSGVEGCVAQTNQDGDGCLVLGHGDTSIALIKAARHRKVPKGDFRGRGAWRKTFRKRRAALLYLVLPNESPVKSCFLQTTSSPKRLPELRFVYRMPGSPRYSYFVVRYGTGGELRFEDAEGEELFGVDLTTVMKRVRALPVSWDAPSEPTVSFDPLPPSFFGTVEVSE